MATTQIGKLILEIEARKAAVKELLKKLRAEEAEIEKLEKHLGTMICSLQKDDSQNRFAVEVTDAGKKRLFIANQYGKFTEEMDVIIG